MSVKSLARRYEENIENQQKSNIANQVINNLEKKPVYVPAQIDGKQYYVKFAPTTPSDRLEIPKMKAVVGSQLHQQHADANNAEKANIPKGMRCVGHHGTPAYSELSKPDVKMKMSEPHGPHWKGVYVSPDLDVAKRYVLQQDGGIFDVYAPKDVKLVNTKHMMDTPEAGAVAKATNRAPHLGGSDRHPSRNIVTGKECAGSDFGYESRISPTAAEELKLVKSVTLVSNKRFETTVEHHGPELTPVIATEVAPDYKANVVPENKVMVQKVGSVITNGGNLAISSMGVVHSAKGLASAIENEDNGGIAVGTLSVASSGANLVSSGAKALSSGAKGMAADAKKLETLTSVSTKATKVAKVANKVAVPLAVVGSTVSAGIDIYEACQDPTRRNISMAAVSTVCAASLLTASVLCATKVIPPVALGATFAAVGVVSGTASLIDVLTDDNISKEEKNKKCLSAGLYIAGSCIIGAGLFFPPVAPIGVGFIVAGVAVDLFA
ncbi:hypothetical protein DFA_01386 [Cavenderia fasciculata]|uniref:Transmembrane protein n=1 Tax=Cavenderia fasciculata TaxID=261658 RepID=F4PSH0_CACFS|nr:uncharacterized protein DFA_01386 [Cavenderia fasciculata]EGG21500.1 hypothetical protein DFA_01386 [Cavenderia fasciculata]|eukprot:XP_004359350.1 hypothetical protein DFA_01386 [Cavenderia fasciculata]